jgi:two-component system copper resistance phosphate regulon response regulator CusR
VLADAATISGVKTLLIEDNAKTARALKSGLAGEGFDARVARNGEEGFFLLNTESFDLVVLDWMLPGRDGLEVLRALRGSGKKTPVLLLTARDAIEDRVAGLNAGADDYLVKPFAFAELVARLRALLRRTNGDEPRVWTLSDLSLDLHARRVTRGGREIALTPREFDLLAYLLTHQGAPVTRQMIGRDVWREPHRATPLDNVIDVHLAHLRRKIDDGQNVRLIHTVRGVGFVARPESSP